jgi:CubicO group peptidase (beta-lactamase class C family)
MKRKYHSLKTALQYFFVLGACMLGCNLSSGDKVAADDSLEYYPPTPTTTDRAEFRYYYREISRFMDSMLLGQGFNGGALVAKNGQIIYEKYRGLVDLRKPADSLDTTTALHVASSSKPLTGTAVLRLVQENRLSLDDSLQKFFPGFPYHGITVKMLLNHRSGLPNYLYFMSNEKWGIGPDKKWNHQFATNDDVIQMMYEKKPNTTGKPDGRFNYSNTNFMLLASIIERVVGKPFPQYMKEKYFDPLGMTSSYIFTLDDTLTATPSFTNKSTYWEFDFLDATYGDKNLYTTPRDLLKFDQALYTDTLLRHSLQDSAYTPYSNERKSVHNYGLGWRLQMLPNGKKVVYHFGKWHGFNAAFARLIDEKVTIIILGNKFNRAIYNAAQQAYKIFGAYSQDEIGDPDEIDSVKTELLKKDTEGKKKVGKK